MTKRKIARRVSEITCCPAVNVDVNLICSEALVRPYDIESLASICGYLVLYLKGNWTVHGDDTRVKLKGIYHYISGSSFFEW